MKLVPFSSNKYTSDTHFMVSDEDFDKISCNQWYAVKDRGDHLTIRRRASKDEILQGHTAKIQLHRFIFGLLKGDKRVVDHKNSWLDSTREGLRITSTKNNNRYRNPTRGRSLPKGVNFDPKQTIRPYRSVIRVDSKTINLGSFTTPEEAYKEYCKAAKKYFGEFAKV